MDFRMLCLLAGLFAWYISPAQEYITEDAERFAALLAEFPDEITSEAIQADYLKPGTRGIKIFTPKRIQNAGNMARLRSRLQDKVLNPPRP